MSSLYQDLKEGGYLNDYGMVSCKPNEGCENYFLFTAVAIQLAFINKLYNQSFAMSYSAWLYADKCRVETGLYNRCPNWNTRLFSHDELIGLSSTTGLDHHYLYDRGLKHFFSYDNVTRKFFTFKSFLGRIPYVIPFLKYKATGSISLFDQLIMACVFYITPKSNYTNISGKQLCWLMVEQLKCDYPKLCSIFTKQMNKKYGTLDKMFKEYYGENHPFVKWSKGKCF